jgi:hypothetical protein
LKTPLQEPQIRKTCFLPRLKDLLLTHIFEKDLDKRIDKAEVLLISTNELPCQALSQN